VRDGKTKRIEQIIMGSPNRCCRDNEAWTTSTTTCVSGGISGISEPATERFTFREFTVDGDRLLRFQRPAEHKGWEEDDGRIWFFESNY
jgi:hypothetical protein